MDSKIFADICFTPVFTHKSSLKTCRLISANSSQHRIKSLLD